jgi:8-oxo-dGTP diphosphatase
MTATASQTSAGGVAYRQNAGLIEVALIAVGQQKRWQLPKGLVGRGEDAAIAAQREVREEAGIETELLDLIDRIEYWYYGTRRGGGRVRFHKQVYFYLMRYLSGDVADHDQEVTEARWVEIRDAADMLAFANEKNVVRKAREMIAAGD